ncbi:MAG: hypothetical protein KC421_13545 [Anaerolineales bacterium]|nr:hypothetical protein [Anaerolineales bacterium]
MKKYKALLGLLPVAGFMVFFLFIKNPNMGGDGLAYLLPMHNLMNGFGYTFQGEPMLLLPPGYGILAYFVFLFIRDIEFSGMIVSVLAYLLLIPAVFIVSYYYVASRPQILSLWNDPDLAEDMGLRLLHNYPDVFQVYGK